MTMDNCHCGQRITSMGTRWAHLTPGPHNHHPQPAGKPPPNDNSDQYGPRWPRPGSPLQLPHDFWERPGAPGSPQTPQDHPNPPNAAESLHGRLRAT